MGLLNDSERRKKMSAALVKHHQKLIVLCFVGGIVWFGLLASDVFNNKTYFSENALLPGVVVREFNPRSSINRRLDTLKEEAAAHPADLPSAWILGQFRQLGLDVYQNNFTVNYPFGAKPSYKGFNLYAILRAPKVASTEALVISAPYRDYNSVHDNTLSSIALMIELAQSFKKHTYWSKDIIFLVTQYENIGFQAWLDAYHDVSTSDHIISEKLQSATGLIQGVINLEIGSHRFSHIDLKIEGLHGQLPNLDLFNLAVELCNREEIPTSFHSQFYYYPSKPITWENWKHNFVTMSRMILLQATGLPSGGHGLFHRFGIQALTLKSVADKKNTRDSVTVVHLGRVLEGVVRSLNNLLEKFHQSFFFYLLPSTRSYISIGLYILPFSLIALPVLIKALYLYLKMQVAEPKFRICSRSNDVNYRVLHDIFSLHFSFGVVTLLSPFYMDFVKRFTTLNSDDLLYAIQAGIIGVWIVIACFRNLRQKVTETEFLLKMCSVLLLLGGFVFTLALVNISFALIFALLYVPICITLQYRGKLSFLQYLYLILINPFVFTYLVVVAQSYEIDSSAVWYAHFYRGINGHKKLILYSVEDLFFFGNWNYKIVTLIIMPLWCNLFSLKLLQYKEKQL